MFTDRGAQTSKEPYTKFHMHYKHIVREGGAGPVRGGGGWGVGRGEQHCAKMQALVTDNVVLRTL